MSAELVPLGGLYSRGVVEATPWGRAQVAQDCIVDNGALRGRPGYRNVGTSGSVVATPASGAQGIWRFRPHPDLAVTICCIDGSVYWIKDPTTDTAQNGTWALVTGASGVFASTAKICGAQMDQYLYLASDVQDASWRRVRWSGSVGSPAFSLDTIAAMPKPTISSMTETPSMPLTWTLFKDLTVTGSTTPSVAGSYSLPSSWDPNSIMTNWRLLRGASNTSNAAVGGYVTYTLAAAADWRNDAWLLVGVSPLDSGGTNGTVEVSVAADVSGSPGDFVSIGRTYDTWPRWSGADVGGAPNHIYCALDGLPDAIRSAAKYVRFKWVEGPASLGCYALVYGFMSLPERHLTRPVRYYATIYDATTGTESELSAEFTANPLAIVSASALQDVRCGNGHAEGGTSWLAMLAPTLTPRCFNDEAGLDRPQASAVGTNLTLRVTLPSSALVQSGHHVRVWKITTTGKRLAIDYTLTASDKSAGYVLLTDQSGQSALAAELYRPGGAPPAVSAMAVKGRRIVCSGVAGTGAAVKDQHPNRLYVSSYLAINDTSDPYPVFPAVPVDDTDGWQFDLASRADVVRSIIVGDAVYILTSEAVYSMSILAQDQAPQLVLSRGCRSRYGAVYAEDQLIWASSDGVYAARGRSQWKELTAEVRSYYTDVFGADLTTIVAYRNRRLTIMRAGATTETFMRMVIDEEAWTTGTYGHRMQSAACWSEQSGSSQQAWILGADGRVVRMQDTATGYDDDVVIPVWVYRTGWARSADLTRVKRIVADATDALTVSTIDYDGHTVASLSIPAPATGEEVIAPGVAGSRAFKWALGVASAAATVVRSLAWERE